MQRVIGEAGPSTQKRKLGGEQSTRVNYSGEKNELRMFSQGAHDSDAGKKKRLEMFEWEINFNWFLRRENLNHSCSP